MPAGDLIVAPGQVEWDGVLIDVRPPTSGGGAWLSAASTRDGWQPSWTERVAQTSTGGVAGLAVPQPMYPALMGVIVETAVALRWWEAAMVRSHVPRTLVWWDVERDEVRSAPACPWRGEPRTDDLVQLHPHRMIDLQWMIRSGSVIDVIEDGGS